MSGSMMPQGGMASGGAPPQMIEGQQNMTPEELGFARLLQGLKGRPAPPRPMRDTSPYMQQLMQQNGFTPGGGIPVPQMPMGAPQGAPGMAPGGQPPMGGAPGGGMPPQPQGAPPMSQVPPMAIPQPPQMQRPPQMQQNLQAFGRMAQGAPGGHQPLMTPQEMAHLGRYGDQVIAHLTPGEIAVPPEVQTPQIKRDLAHAFQHVGVPPSNFVAGSPTSSINPATGAPEYSLWSSILPVLGAIGGAVAAPYTGGLSVPAGMAIGGGLGGAAGGALDHGTATQIALQALGGGAGGYLGGAMSGAGAAAGSAGAAGAGGSTFAEGLTPTATGAASGGIESGAFDTPAAAAAQAPGSAANTQTFGQMVRNLPLKGAMTAGMGASLGSVLAPQPVQQPSVPAGFNTPMAPLNRNWQAVRGNPGQSYTPSFAGYNPYAAVTGSPYNFYPGTTS